MRASQSAEYRRKRKIRVIHLLWLVERSADKIQHPVRRQNGKPLTIPFTQNYGHLYFRTLPVNAV